MNVPFRYGLQRLDTLVPATIVFALFSHQRIHALWITKRPHCAAFVINPHDIFCKSFFLFLLYPKGQTFAYLRVSKVEQDLEKNKLDILKLAHEHHLGHVEFLEEKVSGKISWRKRHLATLLENAQPGDSLIVSELSRLGRSMLECIEILSIATEKGLHIAYARKNQRNQV
jgi:hypothetical protein